MNCLFCDLRRRSSSILERLYKLWSICFNFSYNYKLNSFSCLQEYYNLQWLNIYIFNFFLAVGTVSCVKGNWVKSFDRKGWSACPKEYPFISGLERSLAALRFLDFILHLEGAECCSTTAVSYECTVVSLIRTIRRFVLSVFLSNLKLNYLYLLLTIVYSFSFYLPYFHFVFLLVNFSFSSSYLSFYICFSF